ncbi:MAG: AmmeMemoRadiSam system protein B [Desulfobacteraceae bacterium]|nr:MAG: AmmeMemoRadiSam system protein B [Desulfobacteraceae bacterium]
MAIRRPHFAGTWYPGTEPECLRTIESFSLKVRTCPNGTGSPKGGILPHAGWHYSGQMAFNVLSCLKKGPNPDTIVIFGRHLHPGGKNYIMAEGEWATPLGNLPIDRAFADGLLNEFSFKIETDSNSDPDNTIELQLPFIKYFFPQTMILPLGVPPADFSVQIGQRVAQLSKSMQRRVLILGSTDLTHYGPNYDFAPQGTGAQALTWVKERNDKQVIDLMLNLNAEEVIQEALHKGNACCSGAAAAAIAAVKELGGRQGDLVDYYTSYDVRPDTSFVGYAGIVFS